MKQIIAVALVWFALAAPTEAGAYTGAANDPTPSPRIEMRGGVWQFYRFGGQALSFSRSFNHHRHDHRSFGFRHYGSDRMLPAGAVRRSLRARDFFPVSYPRLRRGFYHARARDAYGRRVRLVIDPYNGNIIRLRYR